MKKFLFITGVCYLLAELAFNANLLQFMAHDWSSLKSFESVGKIISGVGLWILIAKAVSSTAFRGRLLIILLMLPASLYAMDWLQTEIAHQLVENSTGEERKAAHVMVAIFPDVRTGETRISGFDFDTSYFQTPRGLTYLALLPTLMTKGKDSEQLYSTIATGAMKRLSQQTKADGYKGYQELNNVANRLYEGYDKIDSRFTAGYRPGTPQWDRRIKTRKRYFDQAIEKYLGIYEEIPVGMRKKDFLAHSAVQRRLASLSGKSLGKPFVPGLTQKQFESRYMNADLKSQEGRFKVLLKSDPAAFNAGGQYESDGRNAILATRVPMVSLAVSCVFAIMNASLLIAGGLGIRPSLAIPSTAAIILAILIIPAIARNEISRSQGFREAQEHFSWIGARAVQWVANAEPYVYRSMRWMPKYSDFAK